MHSSIFYNFVTATMFGVLTANLELYYRLVFYTRVISLLLILN